MPTIYSTTTRATLRLTGSSFFSQTRVTMARCRQLHHTDAANFSHPVWELRHSKKQAVHRAFCVVVMSNPLRHRPSESGVIAELARTVTMSALPDPPALRQTKGVRTQFDLPCVALVGALSTEVGLVHGRTFPISFAFFSNNSSQLSVIASASVFDRRNSSGVLPQ
jgi:hypothetical protein